MHVKYFKNILTSSKLTLYTKNHYTKYYTEFGLIFYESVFTYSDWKKPKTKTKYSEVNFSEIFQIRVYNEKEISESI